MQMIRENGNDSSQELFSFIDIEYSRARIDAETARKNSELEDQNLASIEEAERESKIALLIANKKVAEGKVKQLEAQIENFQQNTELRKTFSYLSFGMIAVWLLAILIIVLLQASQVFSLASEVLIALLSSTTVTVVGVFLVVARNIFPSKELAG